MAYTILLRNRAGTNLGELTNVQGRSLTLGLKKLAQFTGSIDAANPQAARFADTDKLVVAVYDDSSGTKTLRAQGPVIGTDKARNAQGGRISFTVAGWGWGLDHRLIGMNPAGATFGTTSLAMVDRGEIMGRIIDALNAGESTNIFAAAGDTGIRRGTITASSTTFVTDWRYKVASEAFANLTGTLDGPDYVIRPVEPVADVTGVQFAALDVAPALGQVLPNVAFEFGTGKHNVSEWHDVTDSTGLANTAVSLPVGYPDNATQAPLSSTDTLSIADRGLHEALVPDQVNSDDLRLKLAQQHVTVRKVPRRVITFTPVAEDSGNLPIEQRRVPRLFADYNVGDTVRFRAVERFPVYDATGTTIAVNEVKTVDLLMRVFSVTVSIDEGGTALVTPTLIYDGA